MKPPQCLSPGSEACVGEFIDLKLSTLQPIEHDRVKRAPVAGKGFNEALIPGPNRMNDGQSLLGQPSDERDLRVDCILSPFGTGGEAQKAPHSVVSKDVQNVGARPKESRGPRVMRPTIDDQVRQRAGAVGAG